MSMAQFDRREWLRMIGLAAGGSFAALTSLGEPAAGAPAAGAPAAGAPAADASAPGGKSPAVKKPIRLSLNENPYGPAPGVVDAIRREFAELCRYTDDGFGRLLARVAAKERLPAEQIILGEILEPLGRHLSQEGGAGGEFLYSDPGYTALIDAAAASGGVGIAIPLGPGMQNDLPAMAARINPRTRAVFLVNPHNPTGTVSDSVPFKSFVREASKHALVIVDEAYLEFADEFGRRTSNELVREGGNVIVFRTFAKVYGLAGLDIGYGLVPKSIAQSLKTQGLDNPHLFNRIAVAAATASLDDAGYVAAVAAKVAQERHIWFGMLRDLNVRFTESSGNFVFFETGMPHAQFSEAMLQEGVEIGRAFPPYGQWARISIGLPHENADARAAVRKILAKGGGK